MSENEFEYTTEITEVESHLEASAPLLYEQKSKSGTPKESPVRLNLFAVKSSEEP